MEFFANFGQWKILSLDELREVIPHNFDSLIKNIQIDYNEAQMLTLEKNKCELWRRIASESLLARKILGLPCDELLLEKLKDTSPFDGENMACLCDLLPYVEKAAMVCFPLNTKTIDIPPVLERMYIFKGINVTDHKSCFCRSNTSLMDGYSVFISDPRNKFEGDSWNLAFELAKNAIENKKKLALGRDYILTGKIQDGKIMHVIIGNKDELISYYKNRNFIYNSNDSINHERANKLDTLDSARKRIFEEGADRKEMDFPLNVKVLHAPVGGSINHTIIVTLMILPEKLLLYPSKETQEQADSIDCFLKKFCKECAQNIQVEIIPVPSDDLAECYRRISDKVSTTDKHIINITGGNRMMGTAATIVARDKTIRGVYRDIDAEKDELEVIQFEKNTLINGKAKNPKPISLVDWDKVFEKPPRKSAVPNSQSINNIVEELWHNAGVC